MIEIFLVVFVLVIVITICLHHNSMKRKLYDSSDIDALLIRDADQLSIRASNSENDIVALADAGAAVTICECLLRRHTPSTARELTDVNVSNLWKKFADQRHRIEEKLFHDYPQLRPKNSLAGHAGHRRLEDIIRSESSSSERSSDEEGQSDRERRDEGDEVEGRYERYKHASS